MNTHENIGGHLPKDWDRKGLPAWTYHSPAMLELEKQELFRSHWQLAGHVNDVPRAGDFFTVDIADERAIIMRGEDGVVRAFHNLCRHRGSRVAAEKSGHCKNALVCPFHGWVYNLDGTLRGAARPQSFGPLDKTEFGLKPIELEIWMGFVFIRYLTGAQRSVAEMMSVYAPELTEYQLEDILPTTSFTDMEIAVNWKSVRDVDNEGYHVAMAHPALQDLYGSTYYDLPYLNGVSRSLGRFNPHAGRCWSVRNYVAIADRQPWLSEDKRNLWGYYGLFPNLVIAVTPESVQFYQEFPLGVDRTLIRGAVYRRPEESRVQRVARYLARRIDRETYKEDIQLSIWSNESMKSSAFDSFHLSDLERGVRSHHDHIRAVLPVTTLVQRPPEDRIAALNDAMWEGETEPHTAVA
ncbi:aromatic ring-hydroxylating dioxygenase subunit alpha [Aestuariivirga sp.]|uniref:aromatic ring-hydroxylating oxygenase subunit alpha n=1 Tax=Aestuariivirga sp. TaxID=2650926 RepID=UPI00359490AB